MKKVANSRFTIKGWDEKPYSEAHDLATGVVFLAVGIGAAAAWHNYMPLGMGAVCLAIGVVSLVREKRT